MDTRFSALIDILRTHLNNFKTIGSEEIVLTYDTVTNLTVPASAEYALIQIEGDTGVADSSKLVRYWEDGTDPSSSSGFYLADGAVLDVYEFSNLGKFKIINLSVTGVVTMRALYYK